MDYKIQLKYHLYSNFFHHGEGVKGDEAEKKCYISHCFGLTMLSTDPHHKSVACTLKLTKIFYFIFFKAGMCSRSVPERFMIHLGRQHQPCLCSIAQLCPTLGNAMDCGPSDSSVRGIFQARILEWVAISYSSISHSMEQLENWSRIQGRDNLA